MNTNHNNPDNLGNPDVSVKPNEISQPVAPDADQLELLVNKAVDGRASRLEWAMLEVAAHEQPRVWRELALTMRDNTLLESVVNPVADRVSQVNLPARSALPPSQASSGLRAWGGWAAAAALGLMFVAQWRSLANKQPETIATAGVPSFSSSEAARDAYLETGMKDGSVLGQVPAMVLVRGVPADNGQGYDVVYIRQIVEQARVPDLMRFSKNELGQQQLVPLRELVAQPKTTRSTRSRTY